MSRTVTLVLVDRAGRTLGALPPFDVALPWWPAVDDVVAGARERYGVDVSVLRMLSAERPVPHGGAVTYLAETTVRPTVALSAARVDSAPHPHRAAYASPGGPAASLDWAAAELRRLGLGAPTGVTQTKTWNLSAIWRLDGPAGSVWLKQVPPFLDREPAVLSWLGAAVPGAAPRLLAADGNGRALLEHVPGEDRFGAPAAERAVMARRLHAVQVRALDAIDALIARGVTDLRGDRMVDAARSVAARYGAGIDGLGRLLDALPALLAAIRACGLPDTLVHGDFHPGNVRGDGASAPIVIDWGEAVVGNPGADLLGLVEGLADDDAAALRRAWTRDWTRVAPGCDPERALRLLPPVQALRGAVIYAGFLDHIEPSEHPYHAADVPACLRDAVREYGRLA